MARLALPDPPLHDDVIALRGFDSSDAAVLVDICQDPEIPRWTGVPSPYGAAEARAYLARVAEGLAAGTRASFGIVDAHDSRLLGMVFTRVATPVVQRAETAHVVNDIYFARTRGG